VGDCLSGNLSFVKKILVGWLSGSWTQKCCDHFGWWPLLLRGKSLQLKASMTGEGGPWPFWFIPWHLPYNWGKARKTSVRVGEIPLFSTIPFSVAFTKLYALRPRDNFTPPHRAALSQQPSVVTFATLRILSCLHSTGLRWSCCSVVWFCCDLEACNLVTATILHFTPCCTN
jgi:hypothetical protein